MPDVLEGYDDDWAEREFWMTEMFVPPEEQRYLDEREAALDGQLDNMPTDREQYALDHEEFDVEVNPGGKS